MNRNRFGWIFALTDLLFTAVAWVLFFLYRKVYVEPALFGYEIPIEFSKRFYLGICLIPLFWLALYYFTGSYKRVYRRSRLRDLANTTIISFLGSLVLFFFLILDDYVVDPANFRSTFIVLFGLNLFIRYIPRFFVLSFIKRKITNRSIGFNTLLVGSGKRAWELFHELENERYSQGFAFRGYLSTQDEHNKKLSQALPCLGDVNRIQNLIQEKYIEEVLIALDVPDDNLIERLLEKLENVNVFIRIVPDMVDIVSGRVKIKNVFGTALIEVNPELMPTWQQNAKRLIDLSVSALVLAIFSPLYLALSVWVKTTSKGPVFYLQERIGKNGKAFNIIKFRTMYVDAEKGKPQLSRKNDPRITPAGRFLRKYRLDELPQFYNVLKGEMSLVGPRPERAFFIEQITKKAPHYPLLLKVRPGITSWGMVKYGYAQNVDQMVERMKYDILYIENMSLAMDLKIFGYTIITILGGRGK